MSRGLENRNPGNIRQSRVCYKGEVRPSRDPEFKQFESPAWGYRAIFVLLDTYRRRHGLRSLREMISRWAPPSENRTEAYIRAVADDTGIDPDEPIDTRDRKTMVPVAASISRVENGVAADRRQSNAAGSCSRSDLRPKGAEPANRSGGEPRQPKDGPTDTAPGKRGKQPDRGRRNGRSATVGADGRKRPERTLPQPENPDRAGDLHPNLLYLHPNRLSAHVDPAATRTARPDADAENPRPLRGGHRAGRPFHTAPVVRRRGFRADGAHGPAAALLRGAGGDAPHGGIRRGAAPGGEPAVPRGAYALPSRSRWRESPPTGAATSRPKRSSRSGGTPRRGAGIRRATG